MKTVTITLRRVGTDQEHYLATDDEVLDRGGGWHPINVTGWRQIEVLVKRDDDSDEPAYFWLGAEA